MSYLADINRTTEEAGIALCLLSENVIQSVFGLGDGFVNGLWQDISIQNASLKIELSYLADVNRTSEETSIALGFLAEDVVQSGLNLCHSLVNGLSVC